VIQPGQHRIEAVAVLSDGTRIASEPVVIEVEMTDDEGRTTNDDTSNGWQASSFVFGLSSFVARADVSGTWQCKPSRVSRYLFQDGEK